MAVAESDVILALYIGESFVEAHISHNQKAVHFNRWYLGKEGFKTGLQKFLQEAGVEKINKAYVASRFIEKIFSYRLGGSVATLTTKGFENWPGLRQPATSKVGPLSSVDLIFSVDERCNAQGEIEKEISETELTELVEKLKAKQAKRVCLHFLNAAKNPANQNKAQEILSREGFEVFIPVLGNTTDEVAQWRKNILNASLSGTFEEVQQELNEGLKNYLPEGQRALFYSSEECVFDQENRHRLCSLWGAQRVWSQQLKKKQLEKFEILYLGLEQFSLIHPDLHCEFWNSPWGLVSAPHVKTQILSLQPTTALEVNSWGELGFSKNVLGFEPGPMFMGRGQVPTLLDLWSESTAEVKGVAERRSPQGFQKFKNQLLALNKSTSHPYGTEEKLFSSLQKLSLEKLSLEIALRSENTRILCMGALARIFATELKKKLPQYQFEVLAENETVSLLNQGEAHAH